MTGTQPRAKKDASTKERILDQAEQLIGLHGLDDLRLRDIAEAISFLPCVKIRLKTAKSAGASVCLKNSWRDHTATTRRLWPIGKNVCGNQP